MIERVRKALSGRYDIEREVGRGGMATVYLAEDRKHRRAVAVKVLDAELGDAIGADRFLREIEICARLDHPHVLPLYDSGAADGVLWFVMPYEEEGSLRDRLRREKQLPVDEALRIAREVADALSYAHGQGVVHRDIKPENIMLSGGHARVADFGVARAISAAGGDRLTRTGLAVGTPPYMSPEQASGSPDIDGRSDLYSLGCVLYEMLAGEPPFTGTAESIARQHLVAEPPPITTRRPAVPAPVAAALMRALSKTPADRFNPAAQFADALRASGPTIDARPAAATDPARAATAFALSSAIVLAVVYLLVHQIGLPLWVFWSAVALVVIGLPIVLATAVAERARAPDTAPGLLSWRRTLFGGALAFGALGLVTVAYAGSRALGIGPAASLLSAGAIGERERVVLADFEDRTTDSSFAAATVTELVRVGLSRSRAVSVVDPTQVGRILGMMRRDPAAGVPADVAVEVAARDGLRAAITGTVTAVGDGYSITARLVSVNGDVLLAETEAAPGPEELTGAVDRLTARMRERFGESLKEIRGSEPLDRVTTGSIQALRTFSQGLQAYNQGDNARALQLIDEAITADSAFAMAYRKLAIILNNQDEQRSRAVWAAERAYEHRDRLTDRERYLVIAAYHTVVTGNRDQQITAYRNVLDRYPDDTYALNNLGVIYGQMRDFERASGYYASALGVDSTNRLYYSNLGSSLASQRLFDSASAIARRFERRFPDNPEVKLAFLINQAMRQNYDSAAVLVEGLLADQRGTVFWEAIAYEWWGHLDALRGRLSLAQQRWQNAFELTAERGLAGTYLLRMSRRALVERLLIDDAAGARALLDGALDRYPLESLSPLDRPYGHLAMAYAAAGDTERARRLIAEYERTPDADHSREGEIWVHGARGVVALAEGDARASIAAFHQFDDGNNCATCGAPWLGRAFDLAGEPDSAVVHYTRFVDQPSSALWYDDSHVAHAYQRLGELHESRGQTEQAADYYRRLVTLMEEADPILRPRVALAQQGLQRVAGEPGTSR